MHKNSDERRSDDFIWWPQNEDSTDDEYNKYYLSKLFVSWSLDIDLIYSAYVSIHLE
jgi:hypothetical protein